MKAVIRLLGLCAVILGIASTQAATLTIKLNELKSSKGIVFVRVIDRPNYESGSLSSGEYSGEVKAKKGTVSLEIVGIPPGEYVIQALQDTNGNQTMDYNFLGLPKEFWGMSRDPKIKLNKKMWDFDEVKVEVSEQDMEVNIRMRKVR